MTTILLVDDQSAHRDFLVALFQRAGHRVVEARDSSEACALAAREHADLVVVTLPPQPEAIMRTVQAALGPLSASPALPAGDRRDHAEHLRLGHLLASSPVVIYSHAIDGGKRQLTYVSDSVQSLLGCDADSCLAAGWWAEHLHPDDRADVLTRWSAPWRDDRRAAEYRFRTHDGRYRWLRDEVRLVRDLAGEPINCVGSWSDLTERKQAEDALGRAQMQYRDVVEASVQGIAILQGGRFCYVNPAGARMFACQSPMELIGEPWELVVAPDDVANLRDRIAACAAGTPVDLHPGWQGIRKDGARIWLESLANPIAWNGQPAVLWFLRDVTQHRHLEEQFRQAQKMEAVGRLAGGVAHDFNNLLTVIIGYSDLMLLGLSSADPLRNLVEQVQHAGHRAAVLTRQLLAFSRKQVVLPVATDLNTLLADMEKMLARLIGEDIELRVAPAAPLWKVKVDPGQIEQVVMNLAINARDAMPHGGKLTIETANTELDDDSEPRGLAPPSARDHVLLAVSDTGCGMDKATIARIFEPFFTTKGPDKGTGLGLATVYTIVKQSGGRIDVYSELGIGTSFKIYLPRDPDAAAAPDADRALLVARGGTETVLLVEDDEQLRALAHLVLGSHGYTVLEAADGVKALQVCEQYDAPIHLMIADVVMPHLGGRQLADRVKALRPATRALFLSGYTGDAIVHHGALDPGAAFLQKPFPPETLARKVREILDE